MCAYAISPARLGIDFTKVVTDGHFQGVLGEEILASDGATYKFVRATAAKTAYAPYVIGSDFTLGDALTTTAASSAPLAVGVPQVDFGAPDSGQTYSYGWVVVKGPLSIWTAANTSGGIAANTEVYTSSFSSGVIHSSVSGLKRIDDLKVTTAGTGTNAVSVLATAFAANYIRVPTDA